MFPIHFGLWSIFSWKRPKRFCGRFRLMHAYLPSTRAPPGEIWSLPAIYSRSSAPDLAPNRRCISTPAEPSDKSEFSSAARFCESCCHNRKWTRRTANGRDVVETWTSDVITGHVTDMYVNMAGDRKSVAMGRVVVDRFHAFFRFLQSSFFQLFDSRCRGQQ